MTSPTTTREKRGRNQFRAWLLYELNLRGAKLPRDSKYAAIREAVERLLLVKPS